MSLVFWNSLVYTYGMEYKTLSANSLISAEQLNELAQDGWRLVCIVPVEYTYYFYFCRHDSMEATPNG